MAKRSIVAFASVAFLLAGCHTVPLKYDCDHRQIVGDAVSSGDWQGACGDINIYVLSSWADGEGLIGFYADGEKDTEWVDENPVCMDEDDVFHGHAYGHAVDIEFPEPADGEIYPETIYVSYGSLCTNAELTL